MRARSTPAQFLADPFDGYIVGRHFVAWCHDRYLVGTASWGVPDAGEIAFLLSMWRLDAKMAEGFEAVTDVSRLEALGFEAFEELARAHREDHARNLSRVARHAIICPISVGGTLVSGFFSRLTVQHERRFFEARKEAVSWLRHPDAAGVDAEVAQLIEMARGRSALQGRLEAYCLAHLRDGTVGEAARELHYSTRSLQRELKALGSSFSDELSRARVAEATRLLQGTTLKLTAIAERIGCSSPSHFSVLYRRWTGRNPRDVREKSGSS